MLHSTRSPLSPYKSSQDRESLDPRSQENTRSGRDEDVAADSGAAFDPNVTRPETSYRKAEATEGGEGDSNSLNASGANQELSKPMGDEPSSKGTGPGKEVRKGGTSRNQSAPKSGSAAKFGEK